jgi:hypothetical protein
MAKATKSKKMTTDPVVTRLRQIMTEVLRDMTDDGPTADERGTIVTACLEDYGDALLLNVEGFLALTMRDILEDEDEEEGEGKED